jgi:hypothetical protein
MIYKFLLVELHLVSNMATSHTNTIREEWSFLNKDFTQLLELDDVLSYIQNGRYYTLFDALKEHKENFKDHPDDRNRKPIRRHPLTLQNMQA